MRSLLFLKHFWVPILVNCLQDETQTHFFSEYIYIKVLLLCYCISSRYSKIPTSTTLLIKGLLPPLYYNLCNCANVTLSRAAVWKTETLISKKNTLYSANHARNFVLCFGGLNYSRTLRIWLFILMILNEYLSFNEFWILS